MITILGFKTQALIQRATAPISYQRGYLCGGYTTTYVKTISALIYDTEALVSSSYTLGTIKYYGCPLNSSGYGWSAGGYTTGAPVSSIDGVSFVSEAFAVKSYSLSVIKYQTTGLSNGSSFGYVCGGHTASAVVNTIEGIVFYNDVIYTSSATIAALTWNAGGLWSTSTGYLCGNKNTSDVIQTLNFGNETTGTASYKLNLSRYGTAAVQSNNYGYNCGGTNGTAQSEIDGFDYTNLTSYNFGASLSTARSDAAGLSTYYKGLAAGGYTTVAVTKIDGVKFTNSTAYTTSLVLPIATYGIIGITSTTQYASTDTLQPAAYIKGYWAGGYQNGTVTSVMEAYDIENDAKTSVTSTLRLGRGEAGATNNTFYGYIAGGSTNDSDQQSSIESINVANDVALSISATLTANRRIGGGLSNNYTGFYVGGYTSTAINVIDALTFSTNTCASYGITLQVTSRQMGCSASVYAGYITGGYSDTSGYPSNVQKLDFLNSVTSILGTRISEKRNSCSATQSNNRSYTAGGQNIERNGTTCINNIDGFRFVDEICFNLSMKLATARYDLTGISGKTKGSNCGGWNGTTYYTTVESITFATETNASTGTGIVAATRWPIGINTIAQTSITEAVNTTDGTTLPATQQKGYVCGGLYTNVSSEAVDIIRLDTNTLYASSYTVHAAQQESGMSGAYRGYICGGYTNTANTNVITTLNYDVDTTDCYLAMSIGRRYCTTYSTLNVGYLVAGTRDAAYSTNYSYGAARFTFSTETYADFGTSVTYDQTSAIGTESYTKGYKLGGSNGTLVVSMDFATETFATASNKLSYGMDTGGCVRSTNQGFIGGNQGGISTKINRFDFVTESCDYIAVILGVSRAQECGVSGPTQGHICGGYDNSSIEYNTCDTITYATSTRSNIFALATVRRMCCGLTTVQQSPIVSNVVTPKAYTAGGWNGTIALSSVERFGYDTLYSTTHSSTLTFARDQITGVSGPNNGYLCMGRDPLTVSSTSGLDRVNYAEDSVMTSSLSLPTCYFNMGGANSTTAGFGFGGWFDYWGVGGSNGINKIPFDTETITNLSATLPTTYAYMVCLFTLHDVYMTSGTSIYHFSFDTETAITTSRVMPISTNTAAGVQSNNVGYVCGGYQTASVADITGFRFLDQTVSNPTVVLATPRRYLSGGSSSTYGYCFGGVNDTPSYSAQIDGIKFATETQFNYGNDLTTNRQAPGTVSTVPQIANADSTTSNPTTISKGYISGGYNGTTYYFTIDCYNHYAETLSLLNYGLSASSRWGAGINNNYKGYFNSGSGGSAQNVFTRLNLDVESTNTLALALTTSRNRMTSFSAVNGYFVGGYASAASAVTEALYFSTETTANTTSMLSARYLMASFVDTNRYAYFTGGTTTGSNYLTTIDFFEYYAESYANTGVALSAGRDGAVGVTGPTKGYTEGGSTGTMSTIINSYTYSNSTVATLAAVSNGYYYQASTNSGVNGYTYGGSNLTPSYTNAVAELRFSNEAIRNTGVAISTATRDGLAAINNGVL